VGLKGLRDTIGTQVLNQLCDSVLGSKITNSCSPNHYKRGHADWQDDEG